MPAQAGQAGRLPLCPSVLCLAANYALGGLNPWGYHAFNLAIHLASGLLLLGIVRRTLSGPRWAARFADRAALLFSAIRNPPAPEYRDGRVNLTRIDLQPPQRTATGR